MKLELFKKSIDELMEAKVQREKEKEEELNNLIKTVSTSIGSVFNDLTPYVAYCTNKCGLEEYIPKEIIAYFESGFVVLHIIWKDSLQDAEITLTGKCGNFTTTYFNVMNGFLRDLDFLIYLKEIFTTNNTPYITSELVENLYDRIRDDSIYLY